MTHHLQFPTRQLRVKMLPLPLQRPRGKSAALTWNHSAVKVALKRIRIHMNVVFHVNNGTEAEILA